MPTRQRTTITPKLVLVHLFFLALVIAIAPTPVDAATTYKVIGWNNLGMHCMDADFSVLTILPPYNTLTAQVIDPTGKLITNPTGLIVTYQAVADPDGSFNSTSVGKTGFWHYVKTLFGASLAVDAGLAGNNMPGTVNQPQLMTFDSNNNWFIAEGIPITPLDDAGHRNTYPLMRVVVRNQSGAILATTDVVLPVSDEMDCRACHASGSVNAARPAAGWVSNPDAQKDYRLNILRVHDDRHLGSSTYTNALAKAGYVATGLYATALGGTPVLCARCHASNALPGTGYAGISPLTAAVHDRHANVIDPTNNQPLDASTNRTACYRCHPGSETRCLRGVMGASIAANGQLAIQCQGCHGSMSQVGAPSRQGWFDEPTCQQCHTGTATHNNGQLLYASVFEPNGQPRLAVDTTFATNPNTPASGVSLYRFSRGHGGLQCEACHGATHAEYPAAHRNDNLQSISLQGHSGTLAECTACHATEPSTTSGGPHGMHPIAGTWTNDHGDAAQGNLATCQACHGTDLRGTILSRVQGDRSLSTKFGTKNFWRGFQVGCYTCHNGPSGSGSNLNHAPVVTSFAVQTTSGIPLSITLAATDSDGNPQTFRIVSQPAHGTVNLTGATATYYPEVGFTGTDSFTYASWDGASNSNLGTVQVTVSEPVCQMTLRTSAPVAGRVGTSVTFTGSIVASTCAGAASYDWDFGDGSTHASTSSANHTFQSAKSYTWVFTVTAGGHSTTSSGVIAISADTTAPVPTAFHTVMPCRILDTRSTSGPDAGTPALAPGERRVVAVTGLCDIVSGAAAISANVTVVGPQASGELRTTAGNMPSTTTSVLSFQPNRARANSAFIQLSTDGSGTIAVTNDSTGTLDVIIDVSGYFQ